MLLMKPSCGYYLQKVFGLTLEFTYRLVSERFLFDTHRYILLFPGHDGYAVVSKSVSKSIYQYLTKAMSFDTNEIC